MKIPETSANVGAYYGNEENGQWQPNGVVVDGGVGGGVVGSGDAGHYIPHHHQHHPHHLPHQGHPAHRGHLQGYVVTGGYYGTGAPPYAAAPPDDFADYMWMENEEEFDKQVMQQLEEEALMEQCIEAMLEDEQRERHTQNTQFPTTSNGASLAEAVSRSTLNPLAAEFVPAGLTVTEDKQESPPEPPAETPQEPQTTPEITQNTEEPPTQESPEPVQVKPKDSKKSPKADKKTKPIAVKSDTKLQPKKKEVKGVKSEVTVEEKEIEKQEEIVKPLPSPIEETGPKPINYAAAARANKPKKPSPVPESRPVDRPAADRPVDTRPGRPDKERVDKPRGKSDRPTAKPLPTQRKNSAK